MEETRFLIPTRSQDKNGNVTLIVGRFARFKDIFTTEQRDGRESREGRESRDGKPNYEGLWKTFQPSGVCIQLVDWK